MSAVCIQRPKMGSSQPPDGSQPFGYDFSAADQDFLFLRAPTPPPGDPLLSNDDSRLLNMFFQDINSNQYPLSYGEGLNFSEQWISQLPPAFLGHTTSFGQQPSPHTASPIHSFPQNGSPIHGLPTASFQDMFHFGQNVMSSQPLPQQQPMQHFQQIQRHQPAPHAPIDHNTHANAAAVLTNLHNGHHNHHTPRPGSLSARAMASSQSTGAPVDQIRPISRTQTVPVRPARSNEPDTLFTDMMFGSQGCQQHQQRQVEPPELQWGSDTAFARSQGFIPPEHEASDVIERKRMGVMKVLEINKSTATTRASSPLGNGEGTSNGFHHPATNGHVKEEIEMSAPPRKRRKSKAKEEVEEDDDEMAPIPPKSAAKKRKSKVDLNGAEASSAGQDSSGKRRKSAANGTKAQRENLTDAQKRENHIKSEQKRRGAIKEGFDDMSDIVPNLKGGGYSKSTMLNIAGEWLEALLKGNEEISRL
ncbi:hypothetical protein F5Y15DRAFT_151955 [Xylariaceae sp. FL0016]|nr:hypothetical protein F5Y15DRAFT_151955 [Xylariaceae sp. FL0016]